jgi:arylsulfatase A
MAGSRTDRDPSCTGGRGHSHAAQVSDSAHDQHENPHTRLQDVRPNVVLINCDDVGYGDLGCYGSPINKTPALDALAAEGVRFDSFYMASPVCSPSRAALLTGCYPPRIGFGEFDGLPVLFPGQGLGLPPTEVSLGTMLSAAGYRTRMIGKWHCGDQPAFLPTNHGFDHYFGLPYSNDMGRQASGEVDRLWHNYPPLPLMLDDAVIEEQPDQASLTERYVVEAVRFVRESRGQPFFLYLAHLYVHLPIYVQERFARDSQNGIYGAAVECIDWATDVLIHELRALDLEEDTIVIFTSDNGSRTGSNQPLRGGKGTTWEGGMRVPGIVRWPALIAPGRVSDEVVTSMDLLPTLAACCDATVPSDRTIDGRDVSNLWLDENAVSPHEAFFYYWRNDLEAVRAGRWKLHFAKCGAAISELYDLDADPGETTDVYDQRADVVAALEKHAERARCSLGDARSGRVGADVRPIGRVADPRPLTTYDPDHPYYLAEYDLSDWG